MVNIRVAAPGTHTPADRPSETTGHARLARAGWTVAWGAVAFVGLSMVPAEIAPSDLAGPVRGVLGQLGSTLPAALLAAAATAMNVAAGAVLVRLARRQPFESASLALLHGFAGAVLIDLALVASLGAGGLFRRVPLLVVHVAVLAAGARLGRPFVRREVRGADPPFVWGLIAVAWAVPVIVQLASPVAPFVDVLPNHVAPVQHLVTFGSYDPLTTTTSPIYGPSRLFLGYLGFAGTAAAMTGLSGGAAVASLALPATVLLAVAAWRLASSTIARAAAPFALATVPLTFTFLRLADTRATVLAFPLVTLALLPNASALQVAIGLGAGALVHPLIGLLGAGAVAALGVSRLLRGERGEAHELLAGVAASSAIAAPQALTMLGVPIPPLLVLLGAPAAVGAAAAVRLVATRGTAVVVATAAGGAALLTLPTWLAPAWSAVLDLARRFPLLSLGTSIGLVVAGRARMRGIVAAGVGVWLVAVAVLQLLPNDTVAWQSARFEVPKTLAYWTPWFLALATAAALDRGWRGFPARRLAVPSGAPVAAGVLVAGVAVRLLLARAEVFYWDVDLFQHWTDLMVREGPSGFYGALSAPIDYPPGYLYVLWFFGRAVRAVTGVLPPTDYTMRVLSILFDLPLAAIAAYAVGKLADARSATASERRSAQLLAAAFVLLNPAFVLDSAVYGQVDALGALLVIGAGLLLVRRGTLPELTAAALLALGVLTKPHVAVAAVAVVVVIAHRTVRPRLDWANALRLVGVGAVAMGFGLLVLTPFGLDARSFSTLIAGAKQHHPNVSSFALNAWALAGWWRNEGTVQVFGIPAAPLSLAALACVAIVAAVLAWRALEAGRRELDVFFACTAALAGSAFALVTRMHERYAIYAIAFALPLVARRAWRRWMVTASAFASFNLLYAYWFITEWIGRPVSRVGFLEATLFRPGGVRGLAVIGTAIFCWPLVLLARMRDAEDGPAPPPVLEASEPAPPWQVRFRETAASVWRDPLLRAVLALAVAHRIALQVLGLISLTRSGADAPLRLALELWSRWDAPHYLRVAEVGYRTGGEDALFIVFFPFYPLAVRMVAVVLGNFILSGLVVSFVAAVAASVLLHRLVRLDTSDEEARRAVVLLVAFPTAYFLAAPYTESVFLVGVIGAVYAARTNRWPWAAVAATLATGTRVAGLALLPALALEAVRAPNWRERLERLLWTGAGATGVGVYLLINRIVHGDPFHFLEVQRGHWFQHPVAPWTTLTHAVRSIRAPGSLSVDDRIIYGGRLAAAAFVVVVLLAGARRLRAADQVYAWLGLVLVMSASWLLSLPRYVLGIYPIFVVLAWLTRRRWLYIVLVASGFAAQAWFFWRYARGWWTF